MSVCEVGELVVLAGMIGVVVESEDGTVTVEVTVPAGAVEVAPSALIMGAV
ncbi:MAG: hypothetical protein L0I76_18320 [Pseudonocardia sp.]|nr:hypothetical protein [Pseudonocardia sp.]